MILKSSVPTWPKTLCISVTKSNKLMFRKIITACSEDYITHLNTLCAYNVKILNVKTNCLNSNYSHLKDYTFLSLWNKHLFQLVLIFTAAVAQECSNSCHSLLLTQQLHKAQLSGENVMSHSCWRNSLPCIEPKAHYHFHNSLTLDPTMTHLNPLNVSKYNTQFRAHFNIILQSMPRSLELSLLFRFPDQYLVCISQNPVHLIIMICKFITGIWIWNYSYCYYF